MCKANGVIGESSDSFPIVEEYEAKKKGIHCAVYCKLLKLTLYYAMLNLHCSMQSDRPVRLFLEDLTSNISNYKYYNIDCKILKTKIVNALMLLHVNVPPLYKNCESMHKLIKSLQIPFNVICITKTRNKNQLLSNLDLPNYGFVHVNTTTNAAGVAMYTSDNLK